MIRFALPVRETAKKAVWSAIQASDSHYEVVEVWLACIKDIDMPFVQHLIARHGKRLLLVLRPSHGSSIAMPCGIKRDILALAGRASVLVDLDMKTEKRELLLLAKHPDWPRIVSFHDMHKTPSDCALRCIVSDMRVWHPTICKIATLCRTANDSVRLLRLLLAMRKTGKRCIVLGMGPFGLPTRVFGTLWGNDLIFAPEELTKRSAPGQLTRLQLQTIFSALKGA